MAERKPRATREEALNRKIAKVEEEKAKFQAKLEELNAAETALRQQLKDLSDKKKKAERAAEAKAKRDVEKKAQKERRLFERYLEKERERAARKAARESKSKQ